MSSESSSGDDLDRRTRPDHLPDELTETQSDPVDVQADLEQARAELEAMRERLEYTQADLVRAEAQLEDSESLRKERRALLKKLESNRSRLEALRSRKSVRAALRVSAMAEPLLRRVRDSRRGESSPGPGDASPDRAQAKLAEEITRVRQGSSRTSGPTVSIIVLTRNGAAHLERLLPSLDRSRYRSFEVIVVDNASDDSTSEVLANERGFPLRVIRNESNVSFSVGNNQAAAEAKGQYLLLLNNDIEPIGQGWLGAMVDTLEEGEGAVACGALLVYPVRGEAATDLTVQHAGTRFTFGKGGVRAVNVARTDPLQDDLEGVFEVPAATAAALLVDRKAFDRVGGLREGYVYGTEDVDLCLKLKDQGWRILVNGQAVLFHHESATQDTVSSEVTRRNRIGNRALLMATWGPRLTRSLLRDRLLGRSQWSGDRSRTVAITLTHDDATKGWGDYYTAHELGEAFIAAGWEVVYAERHQGRWYGLGQEIDVVISLLDSFDVRQAPEGALTIAWVRNWVDRWLEHPWFEHYDVVTASSHVASQIMATRSRFDPPVIPLATNLNRFHPGRPNPTYECDYAFTGNNWGEGRGVVSLVDVHPGERFLLFGKGWEDDPGTEQYRRGYLSYDLLPELYRSAKVVLDDTASPTLPYAFVNGRVFEALAAGALVISDNVVGSEEMFDNHLPTYTDAGELRAHLDHYLTDEADRVRLVGKLREQVEKNHSYADRPGEFLQLALDHVERPKAAIKIGAPSEEERESWGDTHFADALASGLTKLGMPTVVHILPEWHRPENQAVDVVIHLRGLTPYLPKPGHINVLWIISHPDDISVRECERFDLVLAASKTFVDHLRSLTDTPVIFMPQATDERRFHPVGKSDELATEVLFVGNSRGQPRPAVDWSQELGLPLAVYGSGWERRLPEQNLAGEHFPNERLAHLYASAKVVLNDHWPDMRKRGFISNRIYDALASGAVVVSDQALGLDEIFGDLVPTFSTPDELEEVVRPLLRDDEHRYSLSREASELVLDKHTFSHRAQELIGLIAPLLTGRRKDVEGAAFVATLEAAGQNVPDLK